MRIYGFSLFFDNNTILVMVCGGLLMFTFGSSI